MKHYAAPRVVEDRYAVQRRYVRHPIRVPLAVRTQGAANPLLSRAGDISEGGVSFGSPVALALGVTVDIEIPVHHSRFKLTGTVTSCTALGDGTFRVGLSFVEPGTAFKMKLAEQVLRIEELRETLSAQRGQAVTTREAAQVWVEQYAKSFGDLVPG
ncbi:MAG: PilZ domain-containing protein [Archangiaceae bacterium]|nr:PilZ domain-containing protein [Archangiaceae bacterium]